MRCFLFSFLPLATLFFVIFSVWIAMGGAMAGPYAIHDVVLFKTPTFGKWCWIAIVTGFVWFWMKRKNFDREFMLLALVGIGLFYIGIFGFGYYEFAHDPVSHIQAIEYFVRSGDWLAQRATVQIKNPFYYVLAALIYIFSHAMHWEPWFAVRQLSLCCYLLYLHFSLSIVRLSIRTLPIQRLVFALLVFWPIGFSMPARITPDIPLYACNIAVFYFLLLWQQRNNVYYLGIALVWSGYAILFKNIGLINPAIIFVTIALMIVAKKYQWRRLISWHLFWPIIFNILAFYVTYNNIAGAHQRLSYVQQHTDLDVIASKAHLFLTFDYSQYLHLLVSGWTIYTEPNMSFWTCFMADLFLGEPGLMQWKSPWLELVIGLIGLCMCVHVALFWFYEMFIARKNVFISVLVFVAVAIPVMVLITNRVLFVDYKYIEAYADPRYAFQIVSLFCIMHGRSLEWHQKSSRKELFYLGCGATAVFIVASIAIFLHNRFGAIPA